jgi:hypothetical protein
MDEEFDTADAGSTGCIPVSVGCIKRGDIVMLKGKPCKVSIHN